MIWVGEGPELVYDFSEDGLQRLYLQSAWVTFLSMQAWDLYCHLTFPQRDLQTSAERSFAVWIHDLNRKEFGHHYWKRPNTGVTWARGSERQERGDIHFHAVVGSLARGIVTPELAITRWTKITKGNAKITLFDASKKGIEYIVKQCTLDSGNIETSKSLKR